MTTHVSLLGLGLIPSWQFDMTAANPKINPFVQYPAGMYQTTPQPAYPYYQGPEGISGLGSIISAVKEGAQRAYAKAWQEQADAARRKGVPMYDSPGYNGPSVAGPRAVLRGPSMLLGVRQSIGFGTRAALGLGIGLGAVTLLGKLFGR